MFGTGKAAALQPGDFERVAVELDVHPAHLEAFALAESAGFGWFRDGRIKILPEPHKFYAYLPAGKRAAALQQGLATKSFTATKASGHYKRMSGPGPRYALLERMKAYDRRAAFMAISTGTYQIMGFNHATCGYSSAEAMFNAFCESEANQLAALVAFLKAKNLVGAVRAGNWQAVEDGYNGGGQGGAYAKEMAKHAARLMAGRWKGWKKPAGTPAAPEALASAAPQKPEPAPGTPNTTPIVEPLPAPAPGLRWAYPLSLLVYAAVSIIISLYVYFG